MTGKEKFQAIVRRQSSCCGFWHGHPHEDAREKLFSYFGVADDFSLGKLLGDSVFWCFPDDYGALDHLHGAPLFDFLQGQERKSLGQEGCFSDCEDPAEVDRFAWPDPDACDFSGTLDLIDRARGEGMAVLSGMWSPFFHDVANAFGMEEYFIKMYTDPEVVQAVTTRVVDFYYAASERLFRQAGDRIDALFFGNDFGSQLDLLISPEQFRTFILPHFVRLTRLAKSYGYSVVLHSCGAIRRVIPDLIEAGVDVLHPLQARAQGMDAESLGAEFGGRIGFMGGVDMQQTMMLGTPQEVIAETDRVARALGPNLIISPSHECLLPSLPPENLEALAWAARKYQ